MTDPSLNDLVDAHRGEVQLSDEQRARSRARLLAQVATGAAVSSVATGVAAAHGVTGLLTKLTIGLALAGVAGGAYYAARSQPTPPSLSAPSLPRSDVASRAAPPSSPGVAASEPEAAQVPEAAVPLASPNRAPAAKSSAPKRSSLADEVKTMQEVDGALRSGDASGALALLDRDSSSEAKGMQQERAAARVFALCKLGRFAEGRVEAARFVAHWPRSPLAARVESSCESRN